MILSRFGDKSFVKIIEQDRCEYLPGGDVGETDPGVSEWQDPPAVPSFSVPTLDPALAGAGAATLSAKGH